MRTWKLAIPAGIVMAGFLFCTTATYGKPGVHEERKSEVVQRLPCQNGDQRESEPERYRHLLSEERSFAGEMRRAGRAIKSSNSARPGADPFGVRKPLFPLGTRPGRLLLFPALPASVPQ